MSTLTPYRDLMVVTPDPTGPGGLAINNNFKQLADDVAAALPLAGGTLTGTLTVDLSSDAGVGYFAVGTALDGSSDPTNGMELVLTRNASGNRQLAICDSDTGGGFRVAVVAGVAQLDGFNCATGSRIDLMVGDSTTDLLFTAQNITLGGSSGTDTALQINNSTQASVILNGGSFGQLQNVTGTLYITTGGDIQFRLAGGASTPAVINSSGHLLLGTTTDNGSGALLQVAGSATLGGFLIVPTHTPSSSSDTGTTGTITWDANYLYVCTATNTWKRAALATW